MKSNHPKLKTTPRPLFSCGFFRHCTQTQPSPTNSTPPPPPLTHSQPPPPSPPLPPARPESSSSSSSSSSTTSQSFTQWKFPLPTSSISHNPYPISGPEPGPDPAHENDGNDSQPPPPILTAKLEELFHVAELQFTSGSNQDRVGALHLLEQSLVPNPGAAIYGGDAVACPAVVMRGVVECLKERVGVKPASKVLLALCLEEGNRHLGVEVGAVGVVVEALADLESAVVERAMAVLELLCTVEEGAVEVREHALAVPMMVQVMGRMEGRGKEYAISVLAVIYGGTSESVVVAPPEEVARAAMLALQGDCSARARRKGAHLLKILQEHERLDFT